MRPSIEISARKVAIAIFAIGLCTLVVVVVTFNGWGFSDKSLFDWLEVLVFPLAVGVGVPWLTNSQRAQRAREQELEEQRWQRARQIEEQRAQNDAYASYLDQMAQLLVDERLLSPGTESADVRALARARTLTILSRLDSNQKRGIVQFLTEAGLIQRERPIISLAGADLQGAALGDADLSRTDLRSTDLSAADLSATNLRDASLGDANLRDANLTFALPTGADLSGANLTGANVTQEQLDQASSLKGATMPNGQKYEEWLKDREGSEENGGPS